MPIYDYTCHTCATVVTISHGAYDDSKQVCETCGDQLFKKFGLGGIQFMGDGWGHQSVN
jgi:putative FmdB family regulatory protein